MTAIAKWFSAAFHPKVGWAAVLSAIAGLLLFELNLHTGWHPGVAETSAITALVAMITGYSVPSPAATDVPLPAMSLEPAPAPVETPAPAPAPAPAQPVA